jgi:DNA-directed RNA polymerase specialized sigma24 family protein
MMTDEQVRSVALFFLFSSMDEKVAIQSAQKAIAHLKAGDQLTPSAIIRTTKKLYDQYLRSPQRSRATIIPEHAWILPEHVDMTAWAKFQKDAAPEQVVAVIYSKLLGYTDQQVAEGLGLSIGTTRYRVGKGTRQLGSIMKSSGRSGS